MVWRVLQVFSRVKRLHQIHFDFERPSAHGADVFINVFTLTFKGIGALQTKDVDPQGLQAPLVRSADGDLLNTQNLERTGEVCMCIHIHVGSFELLGICCKF